MAFGQQAGPPATARQVQELLALVQAAGHDGFRDARHPLGLTQRQAGGRFTREEAQALIDDLMATDGESAAATDPIVTRSPAVERRRAELARTLRSLPDDVLAEELQRRGWGVIQP